MPRRNELKEVWGAQPLPWIEVYLRSLKPEARNAAERELHWADSMFTEARASGNPLWIWMAYRHFRDQALPLPEWLLTYFDAVEKRLQAIVKVQPKRACPAIADALFMNWRGRGNAFTTLRNVEEFIAALEMVQSRFKGESAAVGVARAARALRVDKHTVRRHRRAILTKARERHAG